VLRSKLRKQGISGPPPTILLGNLMEIIKSQLSTPNSSPFETLLTHHNTASLIFPKFEEWREQYGMLYSIIQTSASFMIYFSRTSMMSLNVNLYIDTYIRSCYLDIFVDIL